MAERSLSDSVAELEREATTLRNLVGEVLATLKVNRERGTITTDNDELFDGWIERWEKILPAAAPPPLLCASCDASRRADRQSCREPGAGRHRGGSTMAELSEKLGLKVDPYMFWRTILRVGVGKAVETRDHAVVEAVAKWLESQDLDGRDVPAMIRRELLSEGEG